jgi:hypothetical protein
MALVRERTIPAERPPLVGEVSEIVILYCSILLNIIYCRMSLVHRLTCNTNCRSFFYVFGGKARPTRKADNLTVICDPTV